MADRPASDLTVLFRGEEESWNAFVRRIRSTDGELIVVLSSADNTFLTQEEDERRTFLEELAKIRYRLQLASKDPEVLHHAKREGIRLIRRTRTLRRLLHGHLQEGKALRAFSPSLWRQHWRSRLQTIGLLSVPRVRIWTLVTFSAILFGFVVFRLLPAAEVRVWPRSDLISHTMNVTLVESGSRVKLTGHVRILPLIKIEVRARKAITFTDISTEFTGTDARVMMTVTNASPELYSLRKGTRVLNQAGMIFKLQEAVTLEPGASVTVPAKAEHVDLYGQIIGGRGNVPAGLQWEIPGLTPAERKLVTAKNPVSATGGTTSQRTVLSRADLDIARKRLEKELLVSAKQLVEEERQLRNLQSSDAQIELLLKDDVIAATYTGVILPTQFLGQPVLSVPVEGELHYTVPAYNLQQILSTYGRELYEHAGDGKQLLDETVHIDPQKVIIIEFDDNLAWVKLTLDITGTEQFILDPLTPTGARFGRKVRDAIAGLAVSDAQRIVRNFPEVDRVEIRLWPPWSRWLPQIGGNITISPQ